MSDPPRLIDCSLDSLAQSALLAAQSEDSPSEASVAQTLRMLHTASYGSSARARRRHMPLNKGPADGPATIAASTASGSTAGGAASISRRQRPHGRKARRLEVDSHALWIGIAGLLLTFGVVLRWACAVGCSPG